MISTFCPSSSLLEEVYINNHKINELESLHVEMHHYILGNRGIILLTLVVLVLQGLTLL